MVTIYKYPVEPVDEPVITLPMGAKVLSFHVQRNQLYIWAIVNPENPKERRQFYLMGTGHPAKYSIEGMRFIGTAFLRDGALVFHLFEMP